MTTRLTIHWDGTTPGLAEHTLSLGAWLEPLALLLKAVRRAGGVAGAEALTEGSGGACEKRPPGLTSSWWP